MSPTFPLFSLRTQPHGDAHGLAVTDVYGREALSQLYQYDITLEPEANAASLVAPQEFIHAPCTLAFTADASRVVHGIVVHTEFAVAQETGRAVYRLRMVPGLWRATQAVRSKVFLDMSLPQLLRAVLHETGLVEGDDYTLALTQTYPPRPYTVQYNETDYDFLARRCEHEGVHFHFQHAEAGSRVVFADTHGAFPEHPTHALPYDPREAANDGMAVRSVVQHTALRPRAVALRDYHEASSRVVMNNRLAPVDEALWTRAQSGLQSHYAAGVQTEAEASRLAAIRAEELAVSREQYTGRGLSPGLHPGERFAIQGHPFPVFEAEMLVVSVVHQASQGPQDRAAGAARYVHDFVAMPAAGVFRPARVTPRPVMPALLPAVIDGPTQGTAAPIDAEGRYRVVLPFDTMAVGGGRGSCPLRLVTPTAGPGYGLHVPLHVGTHVLVGHLHDDPDRPVIVGAVPLPAQRPPITRSLHTRAALATRGGVRVETDDDAPVWQPASVVRAMAQNAAQAQVVNPGQVICADPSLGRPHR